MNYVGLRQLEASKLKFDNTPNGPIKGQRGGLVLNFTRKRLFNKLLKLSPSGVYMNFGEFLSYSTVRLHKIRRNQLLSTTLNCTSYHAFQSSNQFTLVTNTKALLLAKTLNLLVWSSVIYKTRRFIFLNIETLVGKLTRESRLWLFNVWNASWRFKYFRTFNQPVNHWVFKQKMTALGFVTNRGLALPADTVFLHSSLRFKSKRLTTKLLTTTTGHLNDLVTSTSPLLVHTHAAKQTNAFKNHNSMMTNLQLLTVGISLRCLLFTLKEVYRLAVLTTVMFSTVTSL